MFLDNRDRHGDVWSGCHYWSNFEIGDMNFFRGRRYQDYFQAMDEAGGFFFERWGDAPIHSLGVAMLLEPSQVHHFEDIGYRHGEFHQCPDNAPGGQLLSSETLNGMKGTVEKEGGIGEIIMAALE
ncbi:Glycolipid 2-alpha-mannosyltransferase 2 like protein [Verticillium longisporum]|nr:Glycolipid 2-alpha-mannosyltransferase 2 like protein [Verticillium longisporum]